MKKFSLLILGLLFFVGAGCKKDIDKTVNQALGIESIETEQKLVRDLAESKAKELFAQKANQGLNLTNGPCLAEEIIPDWSVDIVHNPRTAVDDKAENQCQNFRTGKTHHFVEIDINGNVIRIQ